MYYLSQLESTLITLLGGGSSSNSSSSSAVLNNNASSQTLRTKHIEQECTIGTLANQVV